MMSSRFWNKKYEQQLYVLRIAFLGGFGGFIYGYYSGVMNNFLPYNSIRSIKQHIMEDTHGLGACSAHYIVGVILFNIRRGQLEPRDIAKWHSPFFVLLDAFLIVIFPDASIFGWIILGYGTIPMIVGSTIYLAEISPTRIRGAIVATFFFQIAAGQIAYYLINLVALYFDYSSIDDDKKHLEKWHWMLGIIPIWLMFKSKNWLPEYSPNCLYALGKKEKAIEILRKSRPSIDDVVRDVEALKLVENVNEKKLPYWSKNMIAGIACLVAEQLVGMSMVMYYTPRIIVHVLRLHQYSASSKYLMLATLLIKSVLSAIGTLLCIAYVDRYGRRRLLLFSTFGIITCLGYLSFMLYDHTMEVVIASSSTLTGNGGMGNLGSLGLGALGLYFIFHSMGIGTIPWIINTEIYPLRDRILYGVIASVIYWFIRIWMGIVLHEYLDDVIRQSNIGNAFIILCLSSCVAYCIVYIFALETKSYPIEEVEKLLLLEKKMSYDLKQRQVIVTSREEIPYMFSSYSSDEE